MSNKPAAAKRDRTRNDLISAYEAYQRREPLSMDRLLELVRAFAYVKLYHLEHDFKDFGSAETVDDWAQEVVINVWQNLEKFEGNPKSTPDNFYSWVHTIAYHKGTKAFACIDDERAVKVPLFRKNEDGDGEGFEVDNPEIYGDIRIRQKPRRTKKQKQDEAAREQQRIREQHGPVRYIVKDGKPVTEIGDKP